MNPISTLPSLGDLVSQNPNLQPNVRANRFIAASESGQLQELQGIDLSSATGISPNNISAAKDRVTAPGFAQMFENFIQGVDQKKKISKQETQDLILGRSDNIHEAVVKSQEAGVAFNLMIEVRNKLVDSYKELMRMQV